MVASGMTDAPEIGPRTISTPRSKDGKALIQVVTPRLSANTVQSVDIAVERELNAAAADTRALLERNRCVPV